MICEVFFAVLEEKLAMIMTIVSSFSMHRELFCYIGENNGHFLQTRFRDLQLLSLVHSLTTRVTT
jgi:hypothetical protein